MSIFKTNRVRAILALCCLGLPPPGLTQAVTEAPWDDSPAPFVLRDAWIDVADDRRVDRGLQLEGVGGLRVAQGRTLWLQGSLLRHPADPLIPFTLWKLGGGHLELASASTLTGQIVLAEGSLGLAHDDALGAAGNSLDMAAGTRLELRPGVRIRQTVQIRAAATAQMPPAHWGLPPIAGLAEAAVWRVASGEATLMGNIQTDAPIVKDGAGTLRLTGTGLGAVRNPLILAQGGLRVDQLWWGPVQTLTGTVLSGTGQVDAARVAGQLQPGGPDQAGPLLIGQRLALLPEAQTRIRIDAAGQADQLWSFGTARLGGELRVEPTPGAWSPDRRWVIVQAEGGLEYGADGGSDPVSGEGRFAKAVSALRYLDPVLDYGPNAVTLGLRYNAQGLNTADAAWRSALLDDSRFLRESALAHTASGRPWIQSWAANTERFGVHGLPGDDRDVSGLQIGISREVGGGGALAVYAGAQNTRLSTEPEGWSSAGLSGTGPGDESGRTGGAYHVRDRSIHLGLGVSLTHPGWRWTLGAAQSWHQADLNRQADPLESPLHSQPEAWLSQAWLRIQPDTLMPLDVWHLSPYLQATWLRLHRYAVQESGGLAAVTLAAQTDHRWLGEWGVQIQRAWPASHGDAWVRLNLGVRRLWGGSALSSSQAYQADPARRFEAEGLPLARHVLRSDLAVQAPIARRATVTLAYTGQHGGGQMQHGMWLGVRGDFR